MSVFPKEPPEPKHSPEKCWLCGKFRGWKGYMYGYVCPPCGVKWRPVPALHRSIPPPEDAIQ